MLFAEGFSFRNFLVDVFAVFIFVVWFWLLITVYMDLFRRHDISGWAKAIWVIFVIFLPYLGVFVYLIARGHKMSEHAIADAQAQDAATRQYIQQVTGSGTSSADELAKLHELNAKGAISDAEYEQAKAKVLAG